MTDQPEAFDLAITGCVALRGTETTDPRFESQSTIGINDGLIVAIGPDQDEPVKAGEVIDAKGMLAIPGLINCHAHAAMTLFRGAAEDVPVEDWFNKHVWPMEVNLTEEDVYFGTMLACAEMISSGVTSFADHYFYMDQVARAVESSGMRANLGWAFFSNSNGGEGFDQSVDFAQRLNHGAAGRITTSVAPHSTYLCDDADLTRAAEEARRLGVRVHLHAAENMDQTQASISARGITPMRVLEQTGVLDAGTIIAHGCGITTEDVPLLGQYAANLGVAHCPKVYLKLAMSSLTPIKELNAAGVAVGLGTDGVAVNNTLDLLESMRLTALTQKYLEEDARWMRIGHAINLATAQSAQTFGLGDQIGALEVGCRADIALVDISGPHCQPLHDVGAALVYSARAADVMTVVVEGKILMRDRKLLTIDIESLKDEVAGRMARLSDVTHGDSLQNYDP